MTTPDTQKGGSDMAPGIGAAPSAATIDEATMASPLLGDLPIGDLHAAIHELTDLFDIASDFARRGEQVNIDLLAMRVAVLCDAICHADPETSRPFRNDLETLLGHLNLLENTLRRERVQLALNVEAADRRLRAKLAYGRVLPSMAAPAPPAPKVPDDQSNE
jgi:propanediol dehydratase small subunit